MSIEPIRIRISSRESLPPQGDPRQEFWAPLKNSPENADRSISQLEAQLCRQFGLELRSALVEQLSEPLQRIERELMPDRLFDFERFFFRFKEPMSEREWYRYQFGEVFSKFIEMRQQVFRENPSLRHAQERLAAAAGVIFSTRIAGYSSGNLDVFTGSFVELNKAFDDNFESFRVFLEAFVPTAFAEVFNEDFADRFDFAVTTPRSIERSFEEAGNSAAVESTATFARPPANVGSSARERAEWLWRLANGSLLVPFLLAVLVMYFGLRMLSDIRNTQSEAIKPVLEHQLELLKEDRARFREADHQPGVSTVQPAPSPAATSTRTKQR